jgi:hypothetical protein
MPIRFAPPWLKALGSDQSPLEDDGAIHDEMARMKVAYEREERQLAGELFAGPIEPRQRRADTPPALDAWLPTGEEGLPGTRPTQAEPAPASPPTLPPGLAPSPPPLGGTTDTAASPSSLPSFTAPPSAPPPPPADRPVGTFRFEPNKYPKSPKKRPEDEGEASGL